MGKKVFISSTCFDLGDVRAELAHALKELGYQPLWNESPDFPRTPGFHSHDLCLNAVKDCDIYLLIIDRRYGGTYAGSAYPNEDISITWYESKIAFQEGKEVHTFVRDVVWNERPTYKKNKDKGIKPHHVDDPRVFDFIDFIVRQPKDNWIDPFKHSVELKETLKIVLGQAAEGRTRRLPYLANITPPEPNFVGRNEYLNTITEWYKHPDVHIGALLSWGGEGKSSIARKWYDSLEENSIKPEGIFWWGFYRNNSLDRFLDSLLGYLVQGRINLNEMKSAWAKVDKINELIQEAEYLIILDGLEEMQKGEERGPEFGCMSHKELSEILTSLADSKAKGLSLLSTRYPLTDMKNWKGTSYQAKDVESLSIEDGRLLFEKIGVDGDKNDIDAVIEEYKAHALSLTLLAKYLVEDFKGDITKTKSIPPFHSDKEAGGKAHRILLWYARQLSREQLAFMKIFSLFRTAVNQRDFEGVFRGEMETSINNPLREMTLFSFKRMADNLYDRRLIIKGRDDTYTAHPLIKNYFESIFEEDDKKLCHRRIYQYIDTYAPEKPETFEEMQPLFEQVYHGCKAGMYDETFDDIYYQKVQRGQEFFLTWKLGAWETNLSLISNLFQDKDFYRKPLVLKPPNKSYLINTAGASMHCLGRLKEAEGLYRNKIDLDISQEDWENASVGYQNLGLLQILMGKLLEAKKHFKEAIQSSKNIMSEKQERYATSYFAYILFLIGDMDNASIEFERAGELERKHDPSVRYLYSSRGVCYADFLLAKRMTDKALDVTQENMEICKKYNWVDDVTSCYRSLASIYYYQGRLRETEENIADAIERAKKTGRQGIEVESLIELAKIRVDQGLYQEAESVINNALRICQRCSYRFYEPDAELMLAKVYLAQGNKEKAKQFAQSAYDNAAQMNYHWPKIEAAGLLERCG